MNRQLDHITYSQSVFFYHHTRSDTASNRSELTGGAGRELGSCRNPAGGGRRDGDAAATADAAAAAAAAAAAENDDGDGGYNYNENGGGGNVAFDAKVMFQNRSPPGSTGNVCRCS